MNKIRFRLNSPAIIFFALELFVLFVAILVDYKVVIELFAVLLVFAAFAVFFKKPILFVYLTLLSIFIGTLGQIGLEGKASSFLIVEVVFPILALFVVMKALFGWGQGFKAPKIVWLFISFLIWSLLSALISVDVVRGLNLWRVYLSGLVMFVFTYNAINDKKQIQYLIIAFIIWGIIHSLIEFGVLYQMGNLQYGMIGLLIQKNLMITSYGRSNYLASFFILLVPISLGYLLVSKNIKQRIFSIVAILFMMTGIILTLSRGGIIALIVAVMIFLSRTIKIKTFIPLLLIITAMVLILQFNPLTNVLFERVSSADKSSSVFSRIDFYNEVWKMFLENPITGVGMGNLGYHAKFVAREQSSAHNIVLALLGEDGIVGAVFFLGLLLSIPVLFYRKYTKLIDEPKKIIHWSFISAISGCIIHSMVEPTFEGYAFTLMFWAAVATLYRMSEFDSRDAINAYE